MFARKDRGPSTRAALAQDDKNELSVISDKFTSPQDDRLLYQAY